MAKNKFFLGSIIILCSMAFDNPFLNTVEKPVHTAIPDACDSDNSTFEHGEELTYKIYYNWNFIWLAAGEVKFKVRDLGAEYHISAVGRTYSSYEWFFKVRDKYTTIIDKQTMLPRVSIRDVHEGKYKLYDEITFDQENRNLTSLRGTFKEEAEPEYYEVESCMHDVLSILYYMRNVDYAALEKGDRIPIKIFMDREVWPLRVKFLGKKKDKKIKGLGDYNTLKFSPEVIAGTVFDEDTQMTVWASDDANKIPLMIESPVSVGSVKVVLKEYKNLKHELTAALD